MEKIKTLILTRYIYYNNKKNQPKPMSETHACEDTFKIDKIDNYQKIIEREQRDIDREKKRKRSISLQPDMKFNQVIFKFYYQQKQTTVQSSILHDHQFLIIKKDQKNQEELDFELVDQEITLLAKQDWIKMIDDIKSSKKKLQDYNMINIRFSLMTQKLEFAEYYIKIISRRHKMWRLFFEENQQKLDSSNFRKFKYERNEYSKQIELDVKRTQIMNGFFKDTDNQASLQNILQAYSNYDREIGYTQGMNFVAGNLLACYDLTFNDQSLNESFEVIDDREELVFYQLVEIMICKRWRGYFSDGFPQLIRSIHALECWCQLQLPKLFEHFQNLNLDFQTCFTHLYLSLMMNNSSNEFNKTIIDLFLFEGEIIIHRLIVAMLRNFQYDIQKMNFEQLHQFCRYQMTDQFFKIFTTKDAVLVLSLLGLSSSEPIYVPKIQPKKALKLTLPRTIQNRLQIYFGC